MNGFSSQYIYEWICKRAETTWSMFHFQPIYPKEHASCTEKSRHEYETDWAGQNVGSDILVVSKSHKVTHKTLIKENETCVKFVVSWNSLQRNNQEISQNF